MHALLNILRSGNWITAQRIWLWPVVALVASGAGLLFVIVMSNGLNDFQGRPLGSDFSNVYAAGTYVLNGHAAAPFDWPMQFAREKAIFGEQTQFYGWHYPPFFLFVAGALAIMPYLLALFVWQAVTLVLYLLAIRTIVSTSCPALCRASTSFDLSSKQSLDGRDKPGHDGFIFGGALVGEKIWLLLAVAYPAVFVNLGHGHNGFLSAALIGGALVLIDRKPTISGILFGLMAYKPQFGVLIPLVLIASGRWRVFVATAVTVIVLIAVTTFAFGTDVWRAFFDSTWLTRSEVLEQGATGWQKIQTVFSWVRMWGGSITLAYAVQGAVTVAVVIVLMRLWRRKQIAFAIKAAAFAIGTILVTPYSLDYDLMVLAPAIAFLAANGISSDFEPWEKTALAFVWFMPLFARAIAEYLFIPIAVWAMFALFALALRHDDSETRAIAR